MRPWGSCAAVLMLGALSWGCSQMDHPAYMAPGAPNVGETQSAELQRVQFRDVPVPHGFQLVTRGNRTFSFQGGGIRIGRFHYWGQQPLEEVVSFYQETMPLPAYRWEAAVLRSEDGAAHMTFTRNNQTCEVAVTPDGEATRVLVSVSGPDPSS